MMSRCILGALLPKSPKNKIKRATLVHIGPNPGELAEARQPSTEATGQDLIFGAGESSHFGCKKKRLFLHA